MRARQPHFSPRGYNQLANDRGSIPDGWNVAPEPGIDTRRNHPTRRNPSDPTFVWYGSRPTAARAMMASVLLIAEDETYVRIVAELVERAGYETISAGTVAEVRDHRNRSSPYRFAVH